MRVNPKRVYPTTLKQLANELRVPADDVGDVLEDWTREQLVAHLSQFPAEVLDSSPSEKRFEEFLREQAAGQECRCRTVRELWAEDAESYAADHLERADGEGAYRCPGTGREWREDYPSQSGAERGPLRLRQPAFRYG